MTARPNVKSFETKDVDDKPVRLTVATDIVDYMHSARAFGLEDFCDVSAHSRFQPRLIAIPDRAQEATTPMVLTLGTNNMLGLVRRDSVGFSAGWKLIDLQQSFPASAGSGAKTRAVAAGWTADDRITLAVAVDSGAANEPSRLLVAYDLTSRGSDWEKIPWIDYGTRKTLSVQGLRILDNGDKTWTMVACCDSVGLGDLYVSHSKGDRSFDKALIFNAAVGHQEIHDFQAVLDPISGPGIAVLGTSGGKLVLSVRPLPEFTSNFNRFGNVPPVKPLPRPDGARVLAVGQTRDGGTDLYVGGQGVSLIRASEIDNQDDAEVVTIIKPQAGKDLEQLEVAESTSGKVIVAARKRNGDLVIAGAAQSGGAFETPLRLRPGVQEFAVVHGEDHTVTSLLVVYSDGRAAFLLQESGNCTWQERPLLVADRAKVTPVSCYGTSLRIMDRAGIPSVDVKVFVSASTLTSVTLNSKTVFIGPDLKAETTTDFNGAVSLYDRVRSLTPAVYRFEIESFGEAIDVNPAGDINQRLSKISGDDLRNATVTDLRGRKSPLLSDAYRSGARRGEVDQLAKAVNSVASLAVGETTRSVGGGKAPIAGVSLSKSGAPFSARLNGGRKAGGQIFAIQADAGGARIADQAHAAAIVAARPSSGEVFVDLGNSIADFFEGLWERVKEGWTFVLQKVGQAYEFICAVGDKIKRFVLRTLEEIGSFFTWLWDQIKVGLDKLWNYLKFLFDWDDIIRCRDQLVRAMKAGLDYTGDVVESYRGKTDAMFDSVLTVIKAAKQAGGFKVVGETETPGHPLNKMNPNQRELHDQASGNSALNWLYDRISNFFDNIIHIEGPDPVALGFDAVADFFITVVKDEMDIITGTFQTIGADFKKTLGSLSFSEITFSKINEFILAAGVDLIEGLIKAVKTLVNKLFTLAKQILKAMHALLFNRISFPFIESLVELVTGERPDTSFSLVDAFALLIAMPGTVLYKLIFGKAPFEAGAKVNLPFGPIAAQGGAGDFFGAFYSVIGLGSAIFKIARVAIRWKEAATPTVPAAVWKLNPLTVGHNVIQIVTPVTAILQRHTLSNTAVAYAEGAGWTCYFFAAACGVAATVAKSKYPTNPANGFVSLFDAIAEGALTMLVAASGVVAFSIVINDCINSNNQANLKYIPAEIIRFTSGITDQAGTCVADFLSAYHIGTPKAWIAPAALKGGALILGVAEIIVYGASGLTPL